MLLRIYKDQDLIAKVVDDAQTAPIPDIHKAVFQFAERFTRRSWTTRKDDIQALREMGLPDQEIALWASRAAGQSWFVMSADGGGVNLDHASGTDTGRAVGKLRQDYHAENISTCATNSEPSSSPAVDDCCWIGVDEQQPRYVQVSERMAARYGFTPNIIRALSLRGETMHRNELALKLLESPQSEDLSRRHHALVRARVADLNNSNYCQCTINKLLEREGQLKHYAAILAAPDEMTAQDKVILDFAAKLTRNAYKVTARDAQTFRDQGLSDRCYLDVLNTVALQTSIDRLANTLGVKPDQEAIIS